eukprot:symbB.v1.2.013310.t1/scaffold938.1/size150240/3
MAAARCIGFVGLGNMGSGMAANLVMRTGRSINKEKPRFLLFDTCPEAAERVAAQNPKSTQLASSLDAVASECGLILLCLPDGAAVKHSIKAMVSKLPPGSLVVDNSTTSPETAREVSMLLAQQNVGFLDAPVTGAPQRAANGTLTVMVGGCEQRLKEARPVLETFASKILHMGASGNGQLAKALNNCLYNVSCAATAEMLSFAARAQLPLEEFVEVVSSGTGQSFGFNQWAPRILDREFEAPKYGFPMGAAFKDFETLQGAFTNEGLELPPVLTAALRTYQEALALPGLAEEHKGAMVKVWEKKMKERSLIVLSTVRITAISFWSYKWRRVEAAVPSNQHRQEFDAEILPTSLACTKAAQGMPEAVRRRSDRMPC